MNKKLLLYIIPVIAVIIGGILIFPGETKMTGDYKKVLLIGIDGMDPRIMSSLMQDGKLPNFEKLGEYGEFKKLETSISPQSPIAWASIATGSNPGKHNIFDFIRRNPANYLPELSLTKSQAGIASTNYEPYIKGTPLWRITSDAGIPTTIIRWPLTFPVEEINGNLFAGLGVPDIKGLLNSYVFYSTEKPEENEEGAEKVIVVDEEDGIIKTEIKGARTKKGGKVVDITVPMQIRLKEERAILNIQGEDYPIKEDGWSDWILLEFKVNLFTKVTGICKFHLNSIEPFNMYMTTIEIDPQKPTYPITSPTSYSKELAKEIGLFHTLGLPEDTNALNEKRISDKVFMEMVNDIDKERNKVFWKEFENFDSGLYAFVFDGSDRIQHMFWNEKIITDDVFEIDPRIERYYVNKDRFLGEVMQKIDEDTALFVFSDHGISSFERSVNINTWLVENGYMKLKKKTTAQDAGDLFRYVDWENTKAYSVGFTSIFINEKGREAQGIVDPSEKTELIDEIVKGLMELEDEKYNEKAMTNVYKTSEVYNGAYVKDAPDMVVGFAKGYRMDWHNAIGGVTPNIFDDNTKHWMADHLIDPSHVPGTIFTNFEIKKDMPHQMDIAPTVLTMLGLDVPEEMDGVNMY